MMQLPTNMVNLPPYRESVDRAVSAESLRAAASGTAEPSVLLGLCFLAKAGDPVRKEIAEVALRANREYAPAVTVLSVMMDRVDAESVAELIEHDPDNALGYYLQGALLHVTNRDSEAFVTFRKAAACSELRFHNSTTGDALFKALDALNLQGLDRLCALSWTTARWVDFASAGIQPTCHALSEMARAADPATRSELAEILLSLAGHLFAANFTTRWFSQRAAEAAFTLKAELAGAENLPKRNGYAAAVYGLISPMLTWPGIREWSNPGPLQLAQYLPNRIWRAFAAIDPSLMNTCILGETNDNPSESERSALEAGRNRAAQSAKNLLDVALSDPDGIFGAYLKGLPQSDPRSTGGALFAWTPVERLIQKRPDLFQAAAANEEAMAELWKAGENAPSRKNTVRMLDIAWALQNYALAHDHVYPDSLAILFENGYLKPPLEAKSLLTGRPYIYVAAGEKIPSIANDRAQFVLLYDDEPIANGWHECAFAPCLCNSIRDSELREQLQKRGK